MRTRWLLPWVSLAALSLCFCQGEERPPYFNLAQPAKDATGGSGEPVDGDGGYQILPQGPPPLDTTGLCGNEVTPIVVERPNLYFALDRSGSMLEHLPNSQFSKYRSAQSAIVKMLRIIGHRVNYGATAFPAANRGSACSSGVEIASTQLGDPYSYGASSTDGPVLKSFMDQLNSSAPSADGSGGTPTAATLAALAAPLALLPGSTVAVLVTDGAPNCNAEAECDPETCIAHILAGPEACGPQLNCCSVKDLGPNAPLGCFDKDPTALAVKNLAAQGIRTFVVGMPGSEAFASLLDQLATLGGTARASKPFYYPVKDTQALGDSLLEIASSVTTSCDISLSQIPPDKALINVYLDTAILGQSDTDGWIWNGTTGLSLRGEACDRIKQGNVQQVQVVAGCPTVLR